MEETIPQLPASDPAAPVDIGSNDLQVGASAVPGGGGDACPGENQRSHPGNHAFPRPLNCGSTPENPHDQSPPESENTRGPRILGRGKSPDTRKSPFEAQANMPGCSQNASLESSSSPGPGLFGRMKSMVGKGFSLASESYFGKGNSPKEPESAIVLKKPPRIVEKHESSMSGHVSGSVSEPGFPAHHVSQRSKAVFDAMVSSENVEIPLGHPVLEQNEEFGPLVLHGLPLKSPVVQKTK